MSRRGVHFSYPYVERADLPTSVGTGGDVIDRDDR